MLCNRSRSKQNSSMQIKRVTLYQTQKSMLSAEKMCAHVSPEGWRRKSTAYRPLELVRL
jgi:hypothetical protein